MDYKSAPMLLNGVMGLNGEAGECIDILKKHLFHGHELDSTHLAEELGDASWYSVINMDKSIPRKISLRNICII